VTVYLQIVAVTLAVGFLAGWQVNGWREDAQLNAIHTVAQEAAQEAREAVASQELAVDQAQHTAALLAVERERKSKVIERIVTNEVIQYVQTPAAAECGVDARGVRIINAASHSGASGDADTAGSLDGATGDATAAEVVTSVTQNYGLCEDNRNQLLGLQAWVRGLTP
jgi:hypothetical protein